MGRIIVSEYVTLGGVMESPDKWQFNGFLQFSGTTRWRSSRPNSSSRATRFSRGEWTTFSSRVVLLFYQPVAKGSDGRAGHDGRDDRRVAELPSGPDAKLPGRATVGALVRGTTRPRAPLAGPSRHLAEVTKTDRTGGADKELATKRLVEIRSYNLKPGTDADFHRLMTERSVPLLPLGC